MRKNKKKMIKKAIFILSLCTSFAVSAITPAFGAEFVTVYDHDPRMNEAAMSDIIADPSAVYGFRPNPASKNIGVFADADWSDKEVVAKARNERIAYHESLDSMYDMLKTMKAEGKSTEEIARAVSKERNAIRVASYKDDPEGLAKMKARNLEKYGNEDGPEIDYLLKKTGSWEGIIISSFSTNSGMDACLGIYDDHFNDYISMGIITGEEDSINHLIQKGESLWSIAEIYYGDSAKWRSIYKANKKKFPDADLIFTGETLRIPE